MAYLNRHKAEVLLKEAGVESLLLLSPESFYYATGAQPGVATMWRKPGAVAVLVPTDSAAAETAVVSDLFADSFAKHSHIKDVRISPIWVETSTVATSETTMGASDLIADAWSRAGRPSGFSRPSTFDPLVCFSHIADALAENGLSDARLGIEADALTVADYVLLEKALPKATFIDASATVARLKMIKCEEEIQHLRDAVCLSEHGIQAVKNEIKIGVTRSELADVWKDAIACHRGNINLTDSWEYISVGTNPWGGNAKVENHDLIKVDVGCIVNGYTSDTGRTYVMGKPGSVQRSLFDALLAGFKAGSAMLKPGVRLSDIHSTTQAAIRNHGFPAYTRGHFGHGLGAGLGSEQWPFIAANSSVELEPGMVMAFECPWYINGVGGMIIENQLLITDAGHEMMNSLLFELCEIDHGD